MRSARARAHPAGRAEAQPRAQEPQPLRPAHTRAHAPRPRARRRQAAAALPQAPRDRIPSLDAGTPSHPTPLFFAVTRSRQSPALHAGASSLSCVPQLCAFPFSTTLGARPLPLSPLALTPPPATRLSLNTCFQDSYTRTPTFLGDIITPCRQYIVKLLAKSLTSLSCSKFSFHSSFKKKNQNTREKFWLPCLQEMRQAQKKGRKPRTLHGSGCAQRPTRLNHPLPHYSGLLTPSFLDPQIHTPPSTLKLSIPDQRLT